VRKRNLLGRLDLCHFVMHLNNLFENALSARFVFDLQILYTPDPLKATSSEIVYFEFMMAPYFGPITITSKFFCEILRRFLGQWRVTLHF